MTRHPLPDRAENQLPWLKRRGFLRAAAAWSAMGSIPAARAQASMWTEQAFIPGGNGYYSSIVFDPVAGVSLFTNTAGPDSSAGSLYRYQYDYASGSFGLPRKVLSTPAGADAYIRTSGIALGASGTVYGLLYTGNAYPGTNGYSPSAATSADHGATWTWYGPVSPYGRNMSSSMSLTVNEGGTPKFRAWVDNVAGGGLHEMTSMDGLHWTNLGNIWPASLGGGALFSSACRTTRGTLLVAADAFPSSRISTLWQPHGGSWQILETSSVIWGDGIKGAAVVWDGSTIHAYNVGRHWTMPEPT